MNKYLLIFCLILFGGGLSHAQSYVLLSDLEKDFKVNIFSLSPETLYGLHRNIELYNVFLDQEGSKLLLFSVLPETDNKPPNPKLGSGWRKVSYPKIKDQIISSARLKALVFDAISENNTEPPNIKLLQKYEDAYYECSYCVTQYFQIGAFDGRLGALPWTLNLNQSPVSFREFREIFKKNFPYEAFPMKFPPPKIISLDLPLTFHYYLSKVGKIQGQKAYKFWTYFPSFATDSDNEGWGINRFIYLEGSGIVAGSFDFYFSNPRQFHIQDHQLQDNLLQEKLLLADGFQKMVD